MFLPPALLLAAAVAAQGAPPAAKPVELFNGKDLSGWKLRDEPKSHWKATVVGVDPQRPEGFVMADGAAGPASLVNMTGGGTDVYSEQAFGDCVVEVEVLVPKGSNSGIYLMGEYEVQVFDSFGKEKLGQGDMGAIYSAAAPKVNATKKPGEWNKFVIQFQAPRFDGEKKSANAKFLKVTLNDQVVQEDVEVKGPTGGALTGKEGKTGPLLFQGDHGPVAYRNVRVTPAGK